MIAHPCPPACLPHQLAHLGSAFLVEKKDEWILRAGIREGLNLTIAQLRSVCASIKAPVPSKGAGTGKNGNVLKKDIALSLLKFLFPDGAVDGSEINRMLKHIMGWVSTPSNVDVLAAMSELDLHNADAFEHVRKEALNQFEEALFGKGKQCGIEQAKTQKESDEIKAKAGEMVEKLKEKESKAEKAERKRQFDLTPPHLKLLLPGRGTISSVFWARYHPGKKFFRTDYPVGGLQDLRCNIFDP